MPTPVRFQVPSGRRPSRRAPGMPTGCVSILYVYNRSVDTGPLRTDQNAKTSLWKEMPCFRQAKSAIAVRPGGPQTKTCGLRPIALSPLVEVGFDVEVVRCDKR